MVSNQFGESNRIYKMNSLKTIISRITTMNESRNSLKNIGVAVKNSTGELRNVEDILSDLAGKWNTLTEEQRQNLGKTEMLPLTLVIM